MSKFKICDNRGKVLDVVLCIDEFEALEIAAKIHDGPVNITNLGPVPDNVWAEVAA